MKPKFKDALLCTNCASPLEWSDTELKCISCKMYFPLLEHVPDFLDRAMATNNAPENNKIHSGLGSYLIFLNNHRLQKILNPVMFFKNSQGMAILNDLVKQSAKILNVGSGDTNFGEHVLNIDVIPGKHVDLLVDGSRLPFPDQYFNAVVCMDVLEHVPEPEKTIREIDRVLQAGGRVFVTAPFIQRFHPCPNDFRRYTLTGLKSLKTNWVAEKSGIWMGPACGIQEMLTNFCAIFFSFGSSAIYNAFLIFFRYLFYPLQLLDYLLCRYPGSLLMAMDFYALFRKQLETANPTDGQDRCPC